MSKIEIEPYSFPNGSSPVLDFLDTLNTLNPKLYAKAQGLLELFEENGTDIPKKFSKYLRNGIFELRIFSGNDHARLLYFFHGKQKAVFTHGFIKKDQKVPSQEIERAINYKQEYLSRK